MIKFKLDTSVNGSKTQNFEKQIITSIENFTKLNDSTLSKIANLLNNKVVENLQQGKDIRGNAVAPKKQPNGKPIFQNSGQLLKSITQQQVNKNEWNIFVNANRSTIASFLQTGTDTMPPREFFGVSAQTEKEVDTILDQSFSSR